MIPLNVKQPQRIKRSLGPLKMPYPREAIVLPPEMVSWGSLETNIVQLLPTLSKPRVLLTEAPCYLSLGVCCASWL